MNSIKKLLALLLILAMSLTMLFSCDIQLGGDGNKDDSTNTGDTGNNGGGQSKKQLSIPKVTLTDSTVTWLPVEGAVGYEVSVDGTILSLSAGQLYYFAGSDCTVMVRAVGDGVTTTTSYWSTVITIEVDIPSLPTPNVSVSDGYAVWDAIDGATGYEIDMDGETTWLDATITSFEIPEGKTIRVRAVGDGLWFRSSDWTPKMTSEGAAHVHSDDDTNNLCDSCGVSVIITVDFYAINDLHGKFCDTDKQPGVDELGTYLSNAKKTDDYTVFLSSGDMWQGSAESNLTGGIILTEWMNEMGFVSMTLGNHEFDWGEERIKSNLAVANFPFLAINIYYDDTNERVDYCQPSIMIDLGDVQIGIIGAIGDCYSSISADRVEGIHFKTGDALKSLVKAEANRLRDYGADFIVYSIHDGDTDTAGLQGYIDIVFEGHTHSAYKRVDSYGIHHLQGGGENNGITHAEISINSVNGNYVVNTSEVVGSSTYSSLEDDPKTEAIEEKYRDVITNAYAPLGNVTTPMSDSEVEDYVAGLYLEAAIAKWGSQYNIVLGGGFLKTRSPYNLSSGSIAYSDVLSLFPFDNRLVLCSIKGSTLKSRFINPSGDYHTALSEYGKSIQNSISDSATYYVIVDTYTQLYKANNLTVVEYYDNDVYARDLLANAIKEGRLGNSVDHGDNYTLTEISELLEIGSGLAQGAETSEYYYVKGTVTSIANSTYGNLYIEDENGNSIYVYGVYDTAGNRYDSMTSKIQVGDTIVLYSKLLHYYNATYGTDMLELKNATYIKTVN